MNQPSTEQAIRDNEQLAELETMYKETERALVIIGDRMREIKNRLQKKTPLKVERMDMAGEIVENKCHVEFDRRAKVVEMDGRKYFLPNEAPLDINISKESDKRKPPVSRKCVNITGDSYGGAYTKLAGGKYEK